MAIERQHRIFAAHSASVIADLDQDLAAVFQLDPDVFGAGVEGVLHQFFHDRGWALHYLARGDLVGNSVGQNCNAASHGRNLSADAGDRAGCQPSFPCTWRPHQGPACLPPQNSYGTPRLDRSHLGGQPVR